MERYRRFRGIVSSSLGRVSVVCLGCRGKSWVYF